MDISQQIIICLGIIVICATIWWCAGLILPEFCNGLLITHLYPDCMKPRIYSIDAQKEYKFKIKKNNLYYNIVVYRGILSGILKIQFKTIDECEKYILSYFEKRKQYLENVSKFNNTKDKIKLYKTNQILKNL